MAGSVHFRGTVVERQSYLDGTRAYTVEADERDGAAGDGWTLLLSLRWDAITAAGVEEADLTLSHGALELFGAAVGGEIGVTSDDEQGGELLTLALGFDLSAGDDEPPRAGPLSLRGTIVGDDAELTVDGLDAALTGDRAAHP